MASKITTLFEDSAKENALYPRTKVSAVSDANGDGLQSILDGMVSKNATQVFIIDNTTFQLKDANDNIVTFTVEVI